MGKLNVAGWVLSLGAVGQALLLGDFFGRFPSWLLFALLLGPWLLVYTISFCRVAPCGPSRFAQMLIAAMAWYSVDTIACELIWLRFPIHRLGLESALIAHALCYLSALSFIVLIRGVRQAREFEQSQSRNA